jgi:hypothetical protein
MNVPVQFELTDVQLYTNKCAIESRNAYDLVLFQTKFILGSSSRRFDLLIVVVRSLLGVISKIIVLLPGKSASSIVELRS